MNDRVVVLTGKHRPHELMFQAFSLLAGLVYLIGAPPPASVASLMPEWMVRTWAAGMVVSGLLSAAGLAVRQLATSLRLEQAAMLFGAGALIWVGYAVFAFAPASRALLSGGLCLAWALANAVRAAQCQRDLRRIIE